MTSIVHVAAIRRILVPLDGSAISEQAIRVALRIATRASAELHLARVYLPPPWADLPGWAETDSALREDTGRYLESAAARLRERDDVKIHTSVLEDPVRDALCEYIASGRIDLVVMTTHGRTGLRRAWLGSIADGMIRKASAPVLMVRPLSKRMSTRSPAELARILVPLDGSAAAETILPHALAVSAPNSRELILLRVVEPVTIPVHPYAYAAPPARPDAEAIDRLVSDATRYLVTLSERLRGVAGITRVRTRVHVDPRPAKAILDAATQYRARLVAMTTQGRGATRLIVGSVADKVLRGSSVPLLLYRPPPA